MAELGLGSRPSPSAQDIVSPDHTASPQVHGGDGKAGAVRLRSRAPTPYGAGLDTKALTLGFLPSGASLGRACPPDTQP